jgi:RNA polymerase sigma-70 factor, ECF subfamily
VKTNNNVSTQNGKLALSSISGMSTTDTEHELDKFLADAQHRAFAMAKAAVRQDSDALDIVQDAMMQLVKRYSNRTPNEWRMLFYRILQNRINDYFRRQKVRDKFLGWVPATFRNKDDEREDPIASVPGCVGDEPDRHLERQENIDQLHSAVQSLSLRQREAFLLRCWEGLSTADTAIAMQCSEGSVKTHYSRAMASLRISLEDSPE